MKSESSQSHILETINPESTEKVYKEVKIDLRPVESNEQSHISTNIDTQSLKDIENLPTFSSEVSSIPNLISEGRKASSASDTIGSRSCISSPSTNLPSEQIRELMQPAAKAVEVSEQSPEQFMTRINPYFDFEERMDESERKIKFESARYKKLVENKIYY